MLSRQTLLTYFVLSLVALQLVILVMLAFFPYLPDPGLSILNMDVYFLFAPLSTVFLLAIFYSWLVRGIAKEAFRWSSTTRLVAHFFSEPFQKIFSSVRNASLSESTEKFALLSRPRLLLTISVVASVLLAFVPYRPDLNPNGLSVGVDSPLYVIWIKQMLGRSPLQALQYSFVEGLDGSRPLLLVGLYMVASLGVSPSQVIEYLPMSLAPLLSLSSYAFVRYGHGSAGLAGLTALFTPFSFYVSVGLWGSYYANMAALVFAYLLMTILLLFSKSPSIPKYIAMFALSLALFLTHPWTWVLMIAICLVFAFSLWIETRASTCLKSVVGIVLAGVALDAIKGAVFGTRTVAEDIATKLPTTGVVSSVWVNLVDGLLYTHNGLFGNWIILGVGVFACFAFRFKELFERLVLFWVAVASIPFLVLDSYNQTRIVYDLPIPSLMATSLLFFLPAIRNRISCWPGIIIVFLVVLCANYTLQSVLLL